MTPRKTPPISLEEQRALIEQLSQLAAERARAEATIAASHGAREATLRERLNEERQRLVARQQSERTALQSRLSSDLSQIVREYEITVERAIAAQEREYRAIQAESEQSLTRLNSQWETAQAQLRGGFESTVQNLQQSLREFRDRVAERRRELEQLEVAAERVLRRRRCHRAAANAEPKRGICDPNSPLDSYPVALDRATEQLGQFGHQFVAKFLAKGGLVGVFIAIWTIVVGIGVVQLPANNELILWIIAGGILASGGVAILYVVLRPIVVNQMLEIHSRFRQAVADGNTALDAAVTLRAAELDAQKISAQRQCDRALRAKTEEHHGQVEELSKGRESRLRQAADTLQSQRKKAVETRDTGQQAANQAFSRDSQKLQETHTTQMQQFEMRQKTELDTSHEMQSRGWQRLVTRWREGLDTFRTSVAEMQAYCDERFPAWSSTDWEADRAISDSLPALRFGKFTFSLRSLEGGISEHPDLRPPQEEFDLPAAISFASRPSLLLEAWGEGRIIATRAMQNVMLRLLTSLPPGKVRFTIIDPVGLGQNFSAFMHLADFDEKLITHRIWTESQHIQQRLSDLTEHMEDVIQTYLRNEFPTIDEYNRQAGEVAEPFHVLVVANFPAGFSDEAVQRLLSIMHSGARCGVYSMISTDSKLELPRNFDLEDLEGNAATVQWDGRKFGWRDEALKGLPLVLDEPPGTEQLTQIIRAIGRRAKDAIRVEVPFSIVTCPPDQWWTCDSRGGIDIPLGRAGASKLQHLRLGKGTSQHVLISGKTGSGKSTLLHALITNTAIHYNPKEVEFYLIDFKKGVEFKPYAALRLPHARVIAIESEREFGMSVLERLDQELRIRGDLFRQVGVQDIKGFRDEHPDRHMPRTLLIIDEFQEFFTQDDKLSQEAALLLDRLVRQGRAFGIHVLLGSQTLAGAYSLARSTLGQMAVRIALQCSEADSHLILSEDNTAARLLSRPGEAIYNDANGLFEGNHPFQIVWLSGNEQEDYLERLSKRAQEQRSWTDELIVFEGNAPAKLEENGLLRQVLANGAPAEFALAPQAWLGAAVAIKEPTSARFRRQSGANLIVVGQQEELGLGILASCIVSLGAGVANGRVPKFNLLDGTRPEAPEAGWWRRFADQLPLEIVVAGPDDASRVLTSLSEEVARRVESGAETESPVFFVLFNLMRFRDLRRSDDDLGFSFNDDKPASPGKLFAGVLRDGPAVGVHSLIWCDTFNTLNRWLDRATLRELDQRVLFQMSANDSSNLIDSPAASRLGAHRAILYSEELGQQEKFRPYGPPTADWLDWVTQQLARRKQPDLAES